MPSRPRISRRAALTLLAGASLSPFLSRAPVAPRRGLPPCRFVGDAYERGHGWMGRKLEDLSANRRQRARVVIVGGGLAGTACARRLMAAGIDDLVLLEVEDVAGGVARSATVGETPDVPFGAPSILLPDRADAWLWRLLADAGVATAQGSDSRALTAGVVRRRGGLRLRARDGWGAAEDLPDHAAWLRLLSRAREQAGATSRPTHPPAAGGGVDPALDTSSVTAWLEAEGRSHRDALERIQAWCRLRFAAVPDEVSAAVLLADLAQRGLPRERDDLVLPGGAAAIAKGLAATLGERFHTAEVALRVVPAKGAVTVLSASARTALVTEWTADAVALAVPSFSALRMTPSLADLAAILPSRSPWLITAFDLTSWPAGFDPAGQLHVPLAGPTARFTRPLGDVGRVLVDQRPFTSPHHEAARSRITGFEPDTALEYVLPDVAAHFPDLPALVRRADIVRSGHGTLIPAPGWATRGLAQLAANRAPHFLCGADAAPFASCEAALWSGLRGAEDVLNHLRIRSESWR